MEAFILTFETIYSGLYHSKYIFFIRVKLSNWCAAGWLVSLPKRDKTNKERRAGGDLHVMFHLSQVEQTKHDTYN